LLKVGADGTVDTQTVQAPIVGFALTNGGLMANPQHRRIEVLQGRVLP
jgi:hypothetical protein